MNESLRFQVYSDLLGKNLQTQKMMLPDKLVEAYRTTGAQGDRYVQGCHQHGLLQNFAGGGKKSVWDAWRENEGDTPADSTRD